MQPRILIATAVAAVLVAPAAAPAQTPPEGEYVKPEISMYQPREPEIEPESGRVDPSAYEPREPESKYVKPEISMYQPREPEIQPESGRLDPSAYQPREPESKYVKYETPFYQPRKPEPEPRFDTSLYQPRDPRPEPELEPEVRASQLLNGRQHAITKKEAVEHWIILQGGTIHTDVQNPADPSQGYFIYRRPGGAGMAIAPY